MSLDGGNVCGRGTREHAEAAEWFATKEKLIDEKLVKNRNDIAHGEAAEMEPDEFLSLHGEIFGMMQDFYNQIDNCVATDAYKKT